MIPAQKRLSPLEVYIVQVQRTGDEIEQYWIDGRSPQSAIRAAAKYAGVAPDKVLGATLHSNERQG